MENVTHAVMVEPVSPPALGAVLEARPFGLLPVGSQTIVERLLSLLAAAGVREVDLLLRHLPGQTRDLVGHGERWGLALRCHDISTVAADAPFTQFVDSHISCEGIVLGMELALDGEALRCAIARAGAGRTCYTDSRGACLPLCVVDGQSATGHSVALGEVLCIASAADLWAANVAALQGHSETLHIERRLGEGCYAGNGTRVARDAMLSGPSLLGAGVALASQSRVGPNVVMGADVVVDLAASISDSLILSGTYIGPHTTIHGKIVDAGKVIDIHTQTLVRVDDPTIVGSTTLTTGESGFWAALAGLLAALGALACNSLLLALHAAGQWLAGALKRWFDSLIAVGLLLFAVPLASACALARRPRARNMAVYARHGRRVSYRVWRLFERGHPLWCLNYVAVLWQVLAGRVALTGPRLSWAAGGRPIYLHTAVAPGLLSPYVLQSRTNFARQKPQLADARFAAGAPLMSHLLLLARFLLSLLLGVTPRRMPPHVTLMGVPIANLSMHQALEAIAQMTQAPQLQQVAFVNADCLNISTRNADYRALLTRIPLVLADGIGIRQALKWFQATGLRENVNGTDLFPQLCRMAAERGLRLYFLGARPGVAAAAADGACKRFPRLAVAGTCSGYFHEHETAQVIADINASGADILLVAMGVPAQELWIARHASALRVKVAIGVGGLFDFYSNRIARAPLWMRELGLEWIYRLMQEPGRMWRRYLIGNPLFMWRAWRSTRGLRPAAAPGKPSPIDVGI